MAKEFMCTLFNLEYMESVNIVKNHCKFLQAEKIYLQLLGSINEMGDERHLMKGIISSAFQLFPGLRKQSIEGMVHLCNCGDRMVEKTSYAHLTKVCEQNINLVSDLCSMMTELLAVSQPRDLHYIFKALKVLVRLRRKETLDNIFKQIYASELVIRKLYYRFLTKWFLKGITNGVEELLISKLYIAIEDLDSEDEFYLQNILVKLKEGDYLVD